MFLRFRGRSSAHDTDMGLITLGSRYIYDLYYEKEAISKQLYDWLLKNNYADANLIAKWKKQGYEKVSLDLMPLCWGRDGYADSR